VGGYTGEGITYDLLKLTETSGWTNEGQAPSVAGVGSDDSGTTVLNGVLYLLGGIYSSSSGVKNVSTMVSYDITTGKWSQKASMPTPRRGLVVASDEANGKLYAVGGINCKQNCYGEDVEYLSTVEAYDAATDSWTAVPDMQVPRRDGAVGFAGGKLVVAGGCNNPEGSSTKCNALNSVELFDVARGTWEAGPSMNMARHGFGIGLCPTLASGATPVVAFGGSAEAGIMNNPTPTGSAEVLLLGEAKAWSEIASLAVPRYGLLKGFGLRVGDDIYAVGGSRKKTGQLNPANNVEKLSCSELAMMISV